MNFHIIGANIYLLFVINPQTTWMTNELLLWKKVRPSNKNVIVYLHSDGMKKKKMGSEINWKSIIFFINPVRSRHSSETVQHGICRNITHFVDRQISIRHFTRLSCVRVHFHSMIKFISRITAIFCACQPHYGIIPLVCVFSLLNCSLVY